MIFPPPYHDLKKALWMGLVVLTLGSPRVLAQELSVSAIQLEETDTRFKNGLGLRSTFYSGRYGVVLNYWGEGFNEVSKNSFLFHGFRTFFPTTTLRLEGKVGLGVLYENTTLERKDRADQKNPRWNAGVLLGVDLALFSYQKFSVHAHWDSALFPPNLLVVILGITGRKQILGLRFSYLIGKHQTPDSQEESSDQNLPSSTKLKPWEIPSLWHFLSR